METGTYYLWQLILAALAVAAVIGYVVYTALLYKSYEANLREIRAANQRHDDEFKMSMRPWVGFENVTTNLSDQTSKLDLKCYIKNFGASPTLQSAIYYYCSDRADVFHDSQSVFSRFSLLPGDRRGLIIHRKCDWVRTDNKSPVYLLIVAEYKSPFGSHWSRERIKVEVGKNKCAMELFEMGDESLPAVKTYQPGEAWTVPISLDR